VCSAKFQPVMPAKYRRYTGADCVPLAPDFVTKRMTGCVGRDWRQDDHSYTVVC